MYVRMLSVHTYISVALLHRGMPLLRGLVDCVCIHVYVRMLSRALLHCRMTLLRGLVGCVHICMYVVG